MAGFKMTIPKDKPDERFVAVHTDHKGREFMSGFHGFVSSVWIDRRITVLRRVRISEWGGEAPPEAYWGWLDAQDLEGGNLPDGLRISMIQRGELQFKMQAPDSFKSSVREGRGKVIRVRVEVLEDYPLVGDDCRGAGWR